MLRTLLFQSFVELWVQHFKQLGVVGKERPVEIGRVQDEDIPARSEFDRAFEINFVELCRFRLTLQLHPFRVYRMPRATATKLNKGGKGGVRQERRRFFQRVLPHGLDQTLILADLDLQPLWRTQLLEAGKASKGVEVVAGGVGRH